MVWLRKKNKKLRKSAFFREICYAFDYLIRDELSITRKSCLIIENPNCFSDFVRVPQAENPSSYLIWIMSGDKSANKKFRIFLVISKTCYILRVTCVIFFLLNYNVLTVGLMEGSDKLSLDPRTVLITETFTFNFSVERCDVWKELRMNRDHCCYTCCWNGSQPWNVTWLEMSVH